MITMMTLLLAASFALPASAAVDATFNGRCCPGLASCCNEAASWCRGQSCGPAETSEEEAGICTKTDDDILDDQTTCVRRDQSQEDTDTTTTTDTLGPEAIIPRFAIPIPTVSLSEVNVTEVNEVVNTETGTTTVVVTYTEIPWIADYIEGAYRYAVFVGVLLAVVMLMIGGIQWLSSAGNAERVGAAKRRISNAVVGLMLVTGAYILLNTINEDLILLNPIRVKHVIPDQYEWVGTPDEDAPEPSGGSAFSAGGSGGSGGSSTNSSNSAHRDSMSAVCRTGGTLDDLKIVLPAWVESGRRGAAVYVRGGRTGRTSCSWNVRRGQPGIDWLTNHLTGRRISFPSNPTIEQLSSIYEQQVLAPIFADGRACGDCVSWTQQMHACTGRAYPTVWDIKFANSIYKIADEPTCRQAIASIPGGLQFGDAFYTNAVGHQFTYTGGEGLSYEIVEMGGWVNCRTQVAGLGGNAMACISTHGLEEYLTRFVEIRERRRATATGTTGGRQGSGNCMIFRLYPDRGHSPH